MSAGGGKGTLEAEAYIDLVLTLKESSLANWGRALDAGVRVLKAAGDPTAMGHAFWAARCRRGLDNLEGVDQPEWEGILPGTLLDTSGRSESTGYR